jgi:hypothetical protein
MKLDGVPMKPKETDYVIIPSFWLEQLEALKAKKSPKKTAKAR